MEEVGRRWPNLFLDSWLPAIALVLVHVPASEAKDPGFNAPLRYHVGDPLVSGARSPVTELLLPAADAAIVGVDCNHQSRLSASRPQAVRLDDIGVPIENPVRSGPSSARHRPEPDLVREVPDLS